jgi:hypothetical protein
VRDTEALTVEAVEQFPGQRLARGEGDRMHKAVEPVPVAPEVGEQPVDVGIAGDVAGKHAVAAELGGERDDTVLHAFTLVGERHLRTLACAGLRDAVGDRPVAEHAGDQDPPA